MTTTEDPWTVIAGVMAIAAALFGVLSLMGIREQVDLARSQIYIAQQEISLVKDDLEYAKEQSTLVRQQIAQMQRRPELFVCFPDGSETQLMESIEGAETTTPLTLAVINRGTRTAHNARFRIYIPNELQPLAMDGVVREIDGTSYRELWGVNQDSVVVSDVPTGGITGERYFTSLPGSYDILWKAWDDDGPYPVDGYGKVKVTIVQYRLYASEAPES